MTSAASIFAKLILDTTGYKKNLSDAEKSTKDSMGKNKTATNGFADGFKSLTGISLGAAGAVAIAGIAIQKTVKFMKEATAAANESNIVMAKQEAILKATGFAAGLTSDQLQNMASAQSKLTGIDDELIADAQSLLLTFRQIGSEEFPRALQATLDLQTTFGSLDSAALQLGKALNDPIKGITALSRSGVTFSEEQKEMIKNFVKLGDIASAQKIILAEIENQIGGTAEAMERASDGTDRLNVSTENLKEAIGQRAIPFVRQWNDFWADFFDGLEAGIQEQNRYNDAVKAAGLVWKEGVGWIKDGVRVTEMQANAAIAAAMGSHYQAEGIEEVASAAEESALALQEYQSSIENIYKNVTSLAGGLQQSDEDLLAAETELNEYIKKNPWDNKGIQERNQKVIELRQEQQRMVDAWMLNVFTTMAMADGEMSDREAAFLLQYQVDTGMISEENATRALSYWDMATEIFNANTAIQASIDNLHGKTVVITTVYAGQSNGGQSSGPVTTGSGNVIGGAQGTGVQEKMATGGSFTVPGWAGYEGFNMGGVATASAGEKITVQRPGGDDKLIKAVRQMAYDPYENARVLTDYLIKSGR